MKTILFLSALIGFTTADLNIRDDGVQYNFKYNIEDEGRHFREEMGNEDSVVGKYSYVDPNGNLREVKYRADESGFQPEGDISVDKKTAEEAAAIAALAPKVPGPINFNSPLKMSPFAFAPQTGFQPIIHHPFYHPLPITHGYFPFVY